MKKIAYVVLSLLLCSKIALAQDAPGIQNEAAKTLANTAGTSTKLATDKQGRLLLSTTFGPVKAEDAAHTSGDSGVMCLAVSNETFALLSGDGDYTPIATNRVGVQFVMPDFRSYQSTTDTANGILKKEDDAHASSDAGVAVWARRIDTLANSSGTTGDYATINQNSVGALYVQEVGGTANGGTLANAISAASNNSTNVKGSAGTVYSVSGCNINAAVRWLKLYNKATAPTCGTDTPVMRFALPVNNCTTFTVNTGAVFSAGIGYCIVTGAADSDNTSTAASEQTVQIVYK